MTDGDISEDLARLADMPPDSPFGRRVMQRPYTGDDQRHPNHDPIAPKFRWLYGILIAAAGLVTAATALSPLVPETRVHAAKVEEDAAKVEAAAAAKINDHEQRIRAVESRLGDIEKNGLISLNLQLRFRLRSLEADLKTMPANAPGRDNLQEEYDRVNAQWRATNAQLGLSNGQPR